MRLGPINSKTTAPKIHLLPLITKPEPVKPVQPLEAVLRVIIPKVIVLGLLVPLLPQRPQLNPISLKCSTNLIQILD